MRCLIVGAEGSFGGALSLSLDRRGHGVIATTRRSTDAARDGLVFLDLAAPLPALPQVDVAVICAAMARFEECRRYPELARLVNVTAPLELGRSLTRSGVRVIFLSTSAVFDGRKPHVAESETPMPQSAYGRLKAEAEARLLELGSSVSVLRLTKVVKPNTGLFSDWIRLLGEGRTVRAFSDHRFCPLPVAHVVDAIMFLIQHGEGGVYQVSGAEDLSYADAARYFGRRVAASEDRVEAVRGLDNGLDEAELTPFASLATSRLSQLSGFVPPEPLDVLQDIYGREIEAARHLLAAHAG
jgi:dTDP-4-dehydrorhamnose reductase